MFRTQNTRKLITIFVGLFVGTTYANSPSSRPTDKQMVVQGNNKFALELYARLKEEKGNIFFSPYSISTALAMTYAGACGNTAQQMAEVLHFDIGPDRLHPACGVIIDDLNAGAKKGSYQLSVANALWGQKGYKFLNSYLDLVNHNYQGGLNEVDFMRDTEGARKIINDWVEKQTQDKIKELIKPPHLTPLTTLVLTNAIYFKGNWLSQFKKKQTRDESFNLIDGNKVQVPMMHQLSKFNYLDGNGFQALELPYVGNDLSMIVFLPKNIDGLPEFEGKLNNNNLKNWLGQLREQEVNVVLPRFKFTTNSMELSKILKSMGMIDAFIGRRADFSGMTGKKDLFISKVLHKAFIDVNEEGTEAAAATAVIMLRGGPRLIVFRADHPFLFLIRHVKTNSILFMGRVMNPKIDS